MPAAMNRSVEYVRRIIEANSELETRMIKRSSGAGKPARHIRAEDLEVMLALDEPVVAPEGWSWRPTSQSNTESLRSR